MKSKNSNLQPITELQRLTDKTPRFAFSASTSDQARTWQQEFRKALAETLGFLDTPYVDAQPELIEEVDRGDYIRRKVIISTAEGVSMPVYLLIPKGKQGKIPVALAYAGHGYGVKDIIGLREDESERDSPEGYQADFGVALCRQGFLVAAPEIACFGERLNDYSHLDRSIGQPEPSTCHNTATYAIMLGKSVLGMCVRDSVRLVDYLATLPEADTTRLGAMGISGGGMLTLFHAALDERIKACVVSGYFSSFKDSILAFDHCTCNFVPNLLSLAEMVDVAGLIMPRPMLVESGTLDPIFPIESVRKNVKRLGEICAVFGGDPDRDVVLDEFEGDHRISGKLSYEFLSDRVGKTDGE